MKTKITSDLKGIVRLIAVSVITIASAACGLSTALNKDGGTAANTNAAGSKPAAAAPASAPAVSGDAQTAVVNAMQLLRTQPAYQVRTTSTTSMGAKSTNELQEYVAPDRMHMVGDGRETIVIGKNMYVKKGADWQNLGTQMSDMTEKMKKGIEDMTPEERAAATKGLTATYRSLGDDTLDGTAAATYELNSKMTVENAGAITTTTKYWISKSDGLILKEETDGDEMGIKVRSTRIYTYDPNVKIEAPMP